MRLDAIQGTSAYTPAEHEFQHFQHFLWFYRLFLTLGISSTEGMIIMLSASHIFFQVAPSNVAFLPSCDTRRGRCFCLV